MRLLVLRSSAMGDVALTTPVIKGFSEQYPAHKILLVTREAFGSFFKTGYGLQIYSPDLGERHKGFAGLFRLYNDIIKDYDIDYVIDLHDVIRTKVLRILFRTNGIPVKVINKGRREKRLLISGKKFMQLKHSVERYSDVFESAGFKIALPHGPWIIPSAGDTFKMMTKTAIRDGLNIGVAPFARHQLKSWPEEYMAGLLKMLGGNNDSRIWLFGGSDEIQRLEDLRKNIPGSCVISGKLELGEELALMSKLDLMISMDSSNMHMAALVGIKVISIWGATDPAAGFGAWMQPDGYAIRIPVSQLTCRPCTVYGKGKCRRGDHACMQWLTPEIVYQKILDLKIINS